MSAIDVKAYEPIFYPRTLAVIGASDHPMKFGGMIMRALQGQGYEGKIYPVNPRLTELNGMKAYPDAASIPEPVDFAVITVPAAHVLDAVRGCVKRGIKGAEILSAGFREEGPAGAALEKEVLAAAKKGGLRLIGPNCFGLYTPAVGLTLMPGIDFSRRPGPVGFISQSGGGACDAAYMGRGRSVYYSVMISYGNGMDINAAEMLRYFEADDRTEVVGAYLEGVDDGRDFFEALKSCAAKKPVVVLKGGLSEQGHRGAMGHTGSMAGSRQAWDAAIKSANAVPAKDHEDLVNMLMAFTCLKDFGGKGAGILAGGGLRVVDGLDAAGAFGFDVPELTADEAANIQAMLPPAGGKGGNPVDLANPVMAPSVINQSMEILAARDDVHFLVLIQMLFYLLNEARHLRIKAGKDVFPVAYHQDIVKKAMEIRERTGKPLVMVLLDIASDPEHGEIETGRREARLHYTEHGAPVFDTSLEAFSALRRVADYHRRREQRSREV